MATLTIPDTTYLRLNKLADAMHMPLDQFLDDIAKNHSTPVPGSRPRSLEWNAAFENWLASHKAELHVADDSRDAIYGDSERIDGCTYRHKSPGQMHPTESRVTRNRNRSNEGVIRAR